MKIKAILEIYASKNSKNGNRDFFATLTNIKNSASITFETLKYSNCTSIIGLLNIEGTQVKVIEVNDIPIKTFKENKKLKVNTHYKNESEYIKIIENFIK